MGNRRPRLSYANVVSTIALFVALGGTSYTVARNSVGSAQLRANAVNSAKVKNRSLRSSDLAPSARIGRRGPRGAEGPAGPIGTFAGEPEPWKPLALHNGWDLFNTTHQQPGFRKDRQGPVHLRRPADADQWPARDRRRVATLPPGYRPSVRTLFVVSSGQEISFARLIIDPDGTLRRTALGGVLEKDYTSLNGITFWPE